MAHVIHLITRDLATVAAIGAIGAELGYTVTVVEPVDADALTLRVARERPAAVILDLSIDAVAWRTIASALKRSAATRRHPVLGLAVAPDDFVEAARADGVDDVIDRGDLETALPSALTRWVRPLDRAALAEACAQPLSEAALAGIALFNRGEYFEAHERLEEAWNADPGPGRDLYRGLLQIAVAYLQIERHNHAGATKLFLRMWNWLDPLPERCRGVDVAAARAQARAAQQALAALRPDEIERFDRALLRPLRVATSDDGANR